MPRIPLREQPLKIQLMVYAATTVLVIGVIFFFIFAKITVEKALAEKDVWTTFEISLGYTAMLIAVFRLCGLHR